MAYDDTNLGLINNQLTENHLAIPPDNRAQILDDYFNLARANLTSYDNPLDLTQYLVKERDYAPWKAASVSMDFIDVMLFGLTSYNEWKVICCKIHLIFSFFLHSYILIELRNRAVW